jgi:hypothetical protein
MSKFLYQIQSGLNHQHTFGLIDYWVQTLTGSGYTQTSQIQVDATGSITKIGVFFSGRTGTPGVFRISLEDPATPGVYLNSGTAYVDFNSGTGTVDTFAELTIPACPVVLGQYINVVTQTYSGTFDTNNRINHIYALWTGGYNFPNGGGTFRTPCFYYVINGKYYGYPNYKEVSTTVSGTQEAGIKITIPKGAGTTHLLQDIVSKLNGNTPLSILIYASNGTTLLHQSDVIFVSASWRANKFPLSSEFYMKSGETYYIVFKAPSGGTLYFAVVDGYNEQSWESQSQEYMIYVNRASNSVAFTETAGRRMSAQLRFKDLVSLDYYAPTSTFNKAINIKAGTTSYSEYVQLNVTGLSASTPGISASYVRSGAARVGINLVSQTVSGFWTSGGFVEVDAVNMPGLYRIDIPDLAFVSGVNQVTLMIKGYNNTNGALVTYQFTQELMQVDMTQVYPNFNTAGTVGDALNAARSGAFGRRSIKDKSIIYYSPNETDIVKILYLDSASAPKSKMEIQTDNVFGLILHLDAASSISYPGTGTTWLDISGFGNHGTLVNGPAIGGTDAGKYFSFDGANDFVDFGAYTPEADTISIWYYHINYQGAVAAVGFDQYNYGTWSWSLIVGSGGANNYGVFSGGNEWAVSGTWINVVMVRSNPTQIFVNGLWRNAYSTGNLSNPYPGLKLMSSGTTRNAGRLAVVKIWNIRLNEAQILQEFNTYKSRYGL